MECTNHDEIKGFFRFLKEQNAFARFIEEYNDYHHKKSFIGFLKDRPCAFYIPQAFVWGDTLEGHKYWENMHRDWNEWIKRNRNN